jgi:hypothetical protein
MRVFVVGHQKKSGSILLPEISQKEMFQGNFSMVILLQKKLGLNKPIYVAYQNRICKAGRQERDPKIFWESRGNRRKKHQELTDKSFLSFRRERF